MRLVLLSLALLAVSAASPAAAAEPLDPSLFTIGACGGVMTGYDSQQYTCEGDRKPVCELASKRCVCLERIDCGGARNEPF